MSALTVSHDLHIMMLELAVEKLYVPRTSVFDSALMKKTTVMFRLLDDDWLALYPHRSDYRRYRGSNYESEQFYGGKSIVFSIPEASLQKRMKDIDLQMHISKDVSRYFEMHPSQNVGFVIVKLDKLFNGIIKELKERKELAPYLSFHEREPIARSLKETFSILNENSEETGSEIVLYIRVSYFGKSIITEIVTPETIMKAFYAREETNEKYPYQCREIKSEELESGCWGSVTFIPPMKTQNLQCNCQSKMRKELLEQKTNAGSKKEEIQTKEVQTNKEEKDEKKKKDKGKKKKNEKGKGKDKSKVSDEDKDDKTGMTDIGFDQKDKEKDKGGGEKKKKAEVEKKKDVETETEVGEKKKKEDKEREKEAVQVTDTNKDKPREKRKLVKEDKSKEKEKVKEDKGKRKEKVKEDEGKGKEKVKEGKSKEKEKVKEDKGKGKEKEGGKRKEKDEVKKKEEAAKKEDDKGKGKEEGKRIENIILDTETIRKLRRRNAGSCTIGIAEKKIRSCSIGIAEKKIHSCMQFTPPCPCTLCSPHQIYTPPCPMPPCFPPVYYPQMQFSEGTSILQCT